MVRLCHWEREFTKAYSRMLVPLLFDVPVGTRYLKVAFAYKPTASLDKDINSKAIHKAFSSYIEGSGFESQEEAQKIFSALGLENLQDKVRNLVNLILYDPDGKMVGRWDLGTFENPPPVFIGDDFASPGFCKTAIKDGTWSAVIEVWEVFTEKVCCVLEVWGVDERPEGGENKCEERVLKPMTRLERLRKEGVLLGEMHSHTCHSDGRYSVGEIIERAKSLGLDFVAITDHNTTSAFSDFPSNIDLILVRGEELTTFFGHFCLYGIKAGYEWHDSRGNLRILEAIEEAKLSGGLASLAHPNTIGTPVCVGCPFTAKDIPFSTFDLMEVWAGSWAMRRPEIVKTLKLWDALLDQGLKICAIAGRDWHGCTHEDREGVRFPVTAVLAMERTEEAVLEALRNGKVFLTVGPLIDLTLVGEDNEVGIGGSAKFCKRQRLRVTVQSKDKLSGIVTVVHNGKRVHSWRLDTFVGEATFEYLPLAPGRFRVEVWSDSCELLAFTNHVFLFKTEDMKDGKVS